jgi:hypothetical protein
MYNAYTNDAEGRNLVASNINYREAERYLEACSNIEIECIEDQTSGMPSDRDIESASIVMGCMILGAFLLAVLLLTQLA